MPRNICVTQLTIPTSGKTVRCHVQWHIYRGSVHWGRVFHRLQRQGKNARPIKFMKSCLRSGIAMVTGCGNTQQHNTINTEHKSQTDIPNLILNSVQSTFLHVFNCF